MEERKEYLNFFRGFEYDPTVDCAMLYVLYKVYRKGNCYALESSDVDSLE